MPSGLEISPPDLMLKVIWVVHFILSTWALLSSYLPLPYFACHLGVLAFAFWAIVSKESVEAIFMTFVTLAFSILNDILLISLYEPRTHDAYERPNVPDDVTNEHRFAVAMSIINLIIKPVSLFFLFRIYQSRSAGGNILDFRQFGFSTGSQQAGQNRGSYSNMDSSQNPNPHQQQPGGPHRGEGYNTSSGYQTLPPAYPNAPPPEGRTGSPQPGPQPKV